MEKLIQIQQELNAPKSKYNSFGKYYYRSCEDITEALKPLLVKHKALITLTDEIVIVDKRFYVKATARFTDGTFTTESYGWAREEDEKKGMDGSQITGTASSYARKYALNGLLMIDDVKDADTDENQNERDNRQAKVKTAPAPQPKAQSKPQPKKEFVEDPDAPDLYLAIDELKRCTDNTALDSAMKTWECYWSNAEFVKVGKEMRAKLSKLQ